jgi:hypothetical protein
MNLVSIDLAPTPLICWTPGQIAIANGPSTNRELFIHPNTSLARITTALMAGGDA